MIRILTIFLLTLGTTPALASAGDFGLGIIIGDPTGISAKSLREGNRAIDGALAWSLGDDTDFHVHATYLWQKTNVFDVDQHPLDLFYGVGVRVLNYDRDDNVAASDNDDEDGLHIGPRGAIGLAHTFADPKIEVFGELAMIMNLAPATDVDLDLGLGARFYF